MPRPRRRTFDPGMPLAPIRDSRTLAAAYGPAYAAALAILACYWQSGCKPLPRNPEALAGMLRRSQQHVKLMLGDILAITDELCPQLAAAYADLRQRYDGKVARVTAANQSRGNQPRTLAQNAPSPLPPPRMLPRSANPQIPAVNRQTNLLRPQRQTSP